MQIKKKQQKETDLLLRTEEEEDGFKEVNFLRPVFFSFFFFVFQMQALRMKLTHPLKHKCLTELEWDQNRNPESGICLPLCHTPQ